MLETKNFLKLVNFEDTEEIVKLLPTKNGKMTQELAF
jgi:hypothetical protein